MDSRKMQIIMDLSAPVHHLVSDLDQYPRNCMDVVAEIEQHLAHSRKTLFDQGLTTDQIDNLVYATAALTDEVVMRSEWSNKAEWARYPLCVKLFGDARAGRHFFDRIQALRDTPITNALPLWHYWRCLQLGFEGQYRNSDGRALRDILLTLESGLKEAGFLPGQYKIEKLPSRQTSGMARAVWPLHRYLLIGVLALPLLVFLTSDLVFHEKINSLQNYIQVNADNLQHKSKFIMP